MEYKWVFDCDYDEDAVEQLVHDLAVPKTMARILLNRQIDSFEKAKLYFRPDLENLHDPYLMRDMDLAVERLYKALRNGEKILVNGDYDVDGVCGASLLYMALSRLVGPKVSYYIPDRISEGYGLSENAVRMAADTGVSLLLTVDCGITAVKEIALANQLGLDTVVCDHHQPGEELPEAVALLDPKRPDCNYPFKELAGVGVAYKLLQGLYQRLELPQSDLENFLDLVAIGSSADIVPLVDENRILVRHGLDRINYNPRYGVRALLESSGISNREITVGLIVFVFAPRINAVGRLGDAKRAVQLLSSNSLQKARLFARELEKENKLRRDIDETTFKEAAKLVEEKLDPQNAHALVLYKRDWHPGVIGIVASRIVEKFYRPTIMISVVDGIGKGSARSVANFNIYEAIKECSDLLTDFGGHKYAAGLTIPEENIPAFVERFNEVAKNAVTEDDLVPRIHIDTEAEFSDFSPRFVRLLKLLGPFGPMNMRPVFMSRNVRVVGEPLIVGNNHLKLTLVQKGVTMDAIGFNMGDMAEYILEKDKMIDCVYVVEENSWNGRKQLQLRLRAIR
ncbi:MAG: single-stranded-DNA-specific exonuclease RecJ [Calditrichia bacterium]